MLLIIVIRVFAHVLQILRLFIPKTSLSVIAGEACLAPTKHINTCSGAPWHAVIEPRRMAAVGIVSPM